MIHRDKNHPCVVLWSLGNEPDLEHFPQDAYDYWHPLYELAHQLDPQNRPVTLVCCQNDYTRDITTRTMDIVCINRYYGWYNLSGDMDAACYGLNQELDFWAEQHKPVMMSEYGADTVAGLHTAGARCSVRSFRWNSTAVWIQSLTSARVCGRICLELCRLRHRAGSHAGGRQQKGSVHPGPPPQAGDALFAPALARYPKLWI